LSCDTVSPALFRLFLFVPLIYFSERQDLEGQSFWPCRQGLFFIPGLIDENHFLHTGHFGA
jgi:hypothetical protein